jgi:hypothetical protein
MRSPRSQPRSYDRSKPTIGIQRPNGAELGF